MLSGRKSPREPRQAKRLRLGRGNIGHGITVLYITEPLSIEWRNSRLNCVYWIRMGRRGRIKVAYADFPQIFSELAKMPLDIIANEKRSSTSLLMERL